MASFLNSITGNHKNSASHSATTTKSSQSHNSTSSHGIDTNDKNANNNMFAINSAAVSRTNDTGMNSGSASHYNNNASSSNMSNDRFASGSGLSSSSLSSASSTSASSSAHGNLTEAERGTRYAGARMDDAMTRSEERLNINKQNVSAGEAGLHKYVTSEHVSTTIPLKNERVVIEREPITDANIDKAMSGPDFKEAEYSVKLNKEIAVAEKEAVPVERVRLNKVQEQQQQVFNADLRKEHIDVIDNTGTATFQDKTLDNSLSHASATTANSRAQRAL